MGNLRAVSANTWPIVSPSSHGESCGGSYVRQILSTKSDSSECAHLADGGYSLRMKYGAGPSDNLFKTRRNTFRIRTMNTSAASDSSTRGTDNGPSVLGVPSSPRSGWASWAHLAKQSMNLSLPIVLGRLPFCDTTLFRTSQLDEAHEQIARLVNPHRITVLSDPGRLNVRFNGIRDQDISFLHIEYGANVDVKPDGSKEYFFVQTTMEGSSLVLRDKEEYPAPENHTVVMSPDRPYRMRIAARTKRMVVGIRAAALEKHLAHLCGRDLERPLIFSADASSPTAGQYLVWPHQESLFAI